MSSNEVVVVYIKTIDDQQSPNIYKKLNLNNSLSYIRENYAIVDDTLSFAKKEGEEYFCIEREDENFQPLSDIVEEKEIDNSKKGYYLYLKKRSSLSLDWRILNDKRKLNYGRTMSFDGMKVANKLAFKMKDLKDRNFELIGAGGYKKGKLEFKSEKDWIKKTNLFFSADVNVNSVGLGTSIERSKNKNFNEEFQSIYQYTEIGKVSLKLSKENLETTPEFIEVVKGAIDSNDSREEFKNIIEEYGQFIPTEFILGGRAYSKDDKTLKKNSVSNSMEGSVKVNAGAVSTKIGGNSSESKSNSEFYSFKHMGFLGGKHPDTENFDENAWAKSLGDYRNWDCIEYKNPVSIFQFLPDELRKEALESMGKSRLHKPILWDPCSARD